MRVQRIVKGLAIALTLWGTSVGLGGATTAGAATIAVFGDNFTDDFINSLPGFSATLVNDVQIATPGFLSGFDAFYMTRDGASFPGAGLSLAAAAQVFAYVGPAGRVVLLNGDFADDLSSDAFLQGLTANAVMFAAATGHGYIGEFNGAVSALTSNSNGFSVIGLIVGAAGPLGSGNGGSSGNLNLTPAGISHPVTQGLTFPINPSNVEFGADVTGVSPPLVLAVFDNGNPGIIVSSGAAIHSAPVMSGSGLLAMTFVLVLLGLTRIRRRTPGVS